jgi:hypothetical protein
MLLGISMPQTGVLCMFWVVLSGFWHFFGHFTTKMVLFGGFSYENGGFYYRNGGFHTSKTLKNTQKHLKNTQNHLKTPKIASKTPQKYSKSQKKTLDSVGGAEKAVVWIILIVVIVSAKKWLKIDEN